MKNTNATGDLIELHASLHPTKKPVMHYNMSVKVLQNVIFKIQNNVTNDYDGAAQQLLSYMNSAPDNLRAGDSSINSSIGENLDVDFQTGSKTYTGQVDSKNGLKMVNNISVLYLEAASNTILYKYLRTSPSGMLSFVLDLNNSTQLSSVKAPTVSGGVPVLVTDPNGIAAPYLFE